MSSLAAHAVAALDDAIAHLARAEVAAEDVHESRKRLKEVRALARLCAGSKPLRAELRAAARQLAPSRDDDALVEAFDKLRKHFGERRFANVRNALLNRSCALPDVAAVATSLRRLRPRVQSLHLRDKLPKTDCRLRRALRKAATTRSPEDFHELRKRAKDLSYQARFFGADADSLHDLARILGDHHDLVLLRRIVHNSDLDALIAIRLFQLERRATNLGRRLIARKAVRMRPVPARIRSNASAPAASAPRKTPAPRASAPSSGRAPSASRRTTSTTDSR